MKRFLTAIIYTMVILFNNSSFSEDYKKPDKIVFSLAEPNKSKWGEYLTKTYTEAFRRLGIRFVGFKYFPSERSCFLANSGAVDGEGSRVYSVNVKWTNLVRIDEPHSSLSLSAFTANPNIKELHGWSSLKGTDYKVDYRLGLQRCEEQLSLVVKPKNLSAISKTELGLRKLMINRTDIFIEVESTALSALKAKEFRNSNIRKIGLMEEVKLYGFLYKKHAVLAPKLATILKEIGKTGLLMQYQKETGYYLK